MARLVLRTRFYTEGIPGTIIDAYAAGIPVISAKWQSFNDIIDDHATGIGYEFNNISDLKQILVSISKAPSTFNNMKLNCLTKSEVYTSRGAMEILTRNIE